MQAKKMLVFAEPFTDQTTPTQDGPSPERPGFVVRLLHEIYRDAVTTHERFVKKVDVFDSDGFMTVSELSLQLISDDGSYLHFLLFSHSNEHGTLDIGVSVVCHDTAGSGDSGYMYVTDLDTYQVLRSDVPPLSEDSVDFQQHFSLIDLYALREQLSDMMQSPDQDEASEALRVFDEAKQDYAVDEFLYEAGLDNLPVSATELQTLRVLIAGAVPMDNVADPLN